MDVGAGSIPLRADRSEGRRLFPPVVDGEALTVGEHQIDVVKPVAEDVGTDHARRTRVPEE